MDQLRAMLDDAWASMRHPMTSGQKQSALLLVPLTVALLFFGRPGESGPGSVLGFAAPVAVPTAPAAPAPELADAPVPVPAPAPPRAAPVTAAPGARPSPPRPVPPATTPAPVSAPTTAPPTDGGAETAPPPAIVALVRPTAEGADASGDAAMAEAFLDDAGLTATTLTLDPADADLCASVLAAGELVLASTGVGPGLRSCLVEGGATIVAHDALGDLQPGVAGSGQVLSTRRGYVDGLVELAHWASDAGAISGPVGLVTMESARAEAERALPLLAAAGVDIVATAYLDDGSPTPQIPGSVLEFAGSGVETVLLAAPGAVQSQWVQQSAVVSPSTRHLVADAYDAVVATEYPDGFDGSPASTTLVFPWSPAPDPVRAGCDAVWSSSGGPALADGDGVRLYAWCQHVALATAATGGDWAGALRVATFESPLTSDLGPLASGGWGPTHDAIVRWESDCSCWTLEGDFIPRAVPGRR